jgi:hypothetical protein
VCAGTCRLKWKRKLCRNCVRSPRNHRQTPTFTSSHRGAFFGVKCLIGLREGVFQYHSMSVAEIAFQVCSFDHSDISPTLLTLEPYPWCRPPTAEDGLETSAMVRGQALQRVIGTTGFEPATFRSRSRCSTTVPTLTLAENSRKPPATFRKRSDLSALPHQKRFETPVLLRPFEKVVLRVCTILLATVSNGLVCLLERREF